MSSAGAAATTQPRRGELTIVLVEDDDGDARAVERGFKDARILTKIVRATDGVHALEKLRAADGPGMDGCPFVLLVDISMPRMNGIEFVKALRADPVLSKSIVFILTTSKREEDKVAAYDLNVAGYIIKQAAGVDFMQLVELVEDYWRIVELP